MLVKRQKELIPMIQMPDEINKTTIEDKDYKQGDFFKKQVEIMKSFVDQADKTITNITGADENMFEKQEAKAGCSFLSRISAP
jgi:hypothetical protein